jgi:hypothetical protein
VRDGEVRLGVVFGRHQQLRGMVAERPGHVVMPLKGDGTGRHSAGKAGWSIAIPQ